mmetsp:Transcript_5141/g.8622  ORF Transcript_5141/g.8622 Transcript_5141/m.8622 type:complete len:148 (-) Transcript_5141:100-543(-)
MAALAQPMRAGLLPPHHLCCLRHQPSPPACTRTCSCTYICTCVGLEHTRLDASACKDYVEPLLAQAPSVACAKRMAAYAQVCALAPSAFKRVASTPLLECATVSSSASCPRQGAVCWWCVGRDMIGERRQLAAAECVARVGINYVLC